MSRLNKYDKAKALGYPGPNRVTRTLGYPFGLSNGTFYAFSDQQMDKYKNDTRLFSVAGNGLGEINRYGLCAFAFGGNPGTLDIYKNTTDDSKLLHTSTLPVAQPGHDEIIALSVGEDRIYIVFDTSFDLKTFRGVCAYNYLGELVWEFYGTNGLGTNHMIFKGVTEDKYGNVYVIGQTSNPPDLNDRGTFIHKLSPDGEKLDTLRIRYENSDGYDNGVGNITDINKDYIYFTSRAAQTDSLSVYRMEIATFEIVNQIGLSVSNINTGSMDIDKSGNIYVGLKDGNLYKLPPNLATSHVIKILPNPINGISIDTNNDIYVCTNISGGGNVNNIKVNKLKNDGTEIFNFTRPGYAKGISAHPGPLFLDPTPRNNYEKFLSPKNLIVIGIEQGIQASCDNISSPYFNKFAWFLDGDFINYSNNKFDFKGLVNDQQYDVKVAGVDKFGNIGRTSTQKNVYAGAIIPNSHSLYWPDYSTRYVNFGEPDILKADNLRASFTIEIWVFDPENNANYNMIIDHGSTSSNNNFRFLVTNLNLRMYLNTAGNAGYFMDWGGWPFNQWNHLAMSYDGQSVKGFVHDSNGDLLHSVEDAAFTGNLTPALGTPWHAGKHAGSAGSDYQWEGYQTELRFWNVPRSQLEIEDNMFQRLAGNTPGLIAYWPMNEGYGSQIVDVVNNLPGNFSAPNTPQWATKVPFI